MVANEAPNNSRQSDESREYQITGLADMLPDFILPPDGKQHVRNARKEMLLAFRSVVDQFGRSIDRMVEMQERGTRVRRTRGKIEIE